MSDTASNNIVALDRPTTDAALQRDLVTAIKGVLDLAERGEICSVIMVVMKPDHQFRIMREGTHRKMAMMGMLVQALHDLAATDGQDP